MSPNETQRGLKDDVKCKESYSYDFKFETLMHDKHVDTY